MNLKEIIADSLRYSTSNPIKIVVLGLVIFLADIINEIPLSGPVATEVDLVLIIAGTILAIFESGYIFRIIEESTYGSQELPLFNKLQKTFVHGIKEIIVALIYFAIPLLLLIIIVVKINELSGSLSTEFDVLIIISILILASLLYVLYQAAVLNMAQHHGSLKSGFDFKSICKKITKMGFKNLLFVYLLSVFFVVVVEYTLSDTLSILPYNLGDLITGLLVSPLILVFTARVLGLINKNLIN